jgi:thymidylate synthase ThyX
MTYEAKIIADSVGAAHGIRITTLAVTMPRFILAEFNTHRMFSRNAASSRAIPIGRQIEAAVMAPFTPPQWGSNRRGMQAGGEISDTERASAVWLEARDAAVRGAAELFSLGVHKQLANRLLEPFLWTTVVVTATDWSNFFHLRTSHEAQPEFRTTALLMQDAIDHSSPERLEPEQWHLPFINQEERTRLGTFTAASVAAARCARVSYLTHEGTRDTSKDIELADKLLRSGHMSPFEHPAQSLHVPARWGNFVGWKQYRKLIPYEHDPLGERDGSD